MHGDFTGGIASMAWLGFRGGGELGDSLEGRGLAPSPPCGLPDVSKCDSM